MRASAILSLGLAAFATSSPIEARQDSSNYFSVSNFVYGCTSTCDWSFDVTVHGNQQNHPPVKKAVHCQGSLDDQDFVTCSGISDTRSVAAYIVKRNNQLRLRYEVNFPEEGSRYDYYGHRKVCLHSLLTCENDSLTR
jgi:hypothetical protein